jgi:hypothetical protein
MPAFPSTATSRQSTVPGIEPGNSIRTDGVTKLCQDDNNQKWEMQIESLLISIDAKEIVLENIQPLSGATTEELRLDR